MAILGTLQLLQSRGLDISDSWLGILPIVVLSATVFFHFAGLGSVTYLAVMELFSDKVSTTRTSDTTVGFRQKHLTTYNILEPLMEISGKLNFVK